MSNNADWLRQIGVCREINQKINDFGVSDYQRLKIIEFDKIINEMSSKQYKAIN